VIVELIDSHLHLDDAAFARDLDAVLDRARRAGVRGFIAVGTSVASSRRVVGLAARHDDVYAAVAVHPHEAPDATPDALAALAELARHPKVVAVGETGLDWYRDFAPREAQLRAFRAHLDLARRADLPVIVHCRDAYPEVLHILAEHPVRCVVMHCFSGSLEVARVCVDRGYYAGLGGPVTYRNARRALEVARYLPPDRLLLETDAPYLPPEPHRGRRNEPAYLPLIASAVAQARGVAAATVAEITAANAREVFGLPQPAVRE
jgi:TatD DNase family protein